MLKFVQLVRNYCAIVAPRSPENIGEVPGNRLFMESIALPFVNCRITNELLRLFPRPLLLWSQYPSYNFLLN